MKLLFILLLGLNSIFANNETYTLLVLKQGELIKYESVVFVEKTSTTAVFKNIKGDIIEFRKSKIKRIYNSDGIGID